MIDNLRFGMTKAQAEVVLRRKLVKSEKAPDTAGTQVGYQTTRVLCHEEWDMTLAFSRQGTLEGVTLSSNSTDTDCVPGELKTAYGEPVTVRAPIRIRSGSMTFRKSGTEVLFLHTPVGSVIIYRRPSEGGL